MNQLNIDERVKILKLLTEGCSIRTVSRVTGFSINTVVKLLTQTGNACQAFHDEVVKDLNTKRIQCDELWAFIGCKRKRAEYYYQNNIELKENAFGDAWTFTCLDSDSKLIVTWLTGSRSLEYANLFMQDVE